MHFFPVLTRSVVAAALALSTAVFCVCLLLGTLICFSRLPQTPAATASPGGTTTRASGRASPPTSPRPPGHRWRDKRRPIQTKYILNIIRIVCCCSEPVLAAM
eukprot:3114971-Rhodomonas_salina.1